MVFFIFIFLNLNADQRVDRLKIHIPSGSANNSIYLENPGSLG
jgi:hypothetical protein